MRLKRCCRRCRAGPKPLLPALPCWPERVVAGIAVLARTGVADVAVLARTVVAIAVLARTGVAIAVLA